MNRWQHLCLAGAFGSVSVSVSAIDTPPTWETPELVSGVSGYFLNFDGYAGQNRYMQFDHFGEVGIGFANHDQIFYCRRVPGLGWQVTFASPPLTVEVATQPSLAFNLSEQPAMAYGLDQPGQVPDEADWAPFEGGVWIDETGMLGSPGLLEQLGASCVFDHTGRAMFVAVIDDVNFRHDTDGDGSIVDETIESVFGNAGSGATSCSLVVDPIGRPMVAASIGGFAIRFAVRDTGIGWHFVTPVADADFPSLAIVPGTGFPAMAYTDTADNNLVYGEWDGDQWVFTNVDTAPSTGWYPSLAFDPADGNPAIAYQDQGNGNLMLAWNDGVQWNLQVVVAGAAELPTGYTPSLAFNEFGNGFPAIAYFGLDSGLYYIEDPPPLADLDGDGYVGIADFLLLLNAWGDCVSCPPSCSGDLDGDCTVGITDFLLLLAAWS